MEQLEEVPPRPADLVHNEASKANLDAYKRIKWQPFFDQVYVILGKLKDMSYGQRLEIEAGY